MNHAASAAHGGRRHPPSAALVHRGQGLSQDQLAGDADRADRLHLRLPGPHQRRLHPAADEAGPGLLRCRLRPGRRPVLHHLPAVRGAEQPVAREDRRAPDLPAHHGAVGPDLGGHGLRHRALAVLQHPAAARRVRGRLLPRHHPVPDLLVPQPPPGPRDRPVPVRHADHRRPRRPALGNDHGRHGRPRRLAGWQWVFFSKACRPCCSASCSTACWPTSRARPPG